MAEILPNAEKKTVFTGLVFLKTFVRSSSLLFLLLPEVEHQSKIQIDFSFPLEKLIPQDVSELAHSLPI